MAFSFNILIKENEVGKKIHERITPNSLKRLLNFYPPYLGAGVKVEYISGDWKEMRISMKLRWYNRNIVGTHFGGSLYSMVDPHLMLMLMQLLGSDYIVWDKSASINFIRPGTGRVSATFLIPDEVIEAIKEGVERKNKFLPEFNVAVIDENDKIVAKIEKTLYVRRKAKLFKKT